MATLGSFAGVKFSVSSKKIKTFSDMQWDMEANYAEHDRHIKRDLLEFLGPKLEQITLKMEFSVFIGTDPYKELKTLRTIIEKGKVDYLILGGKKYGSYKWAATKMTVAVKRFDKKGNMLSATANVTLKEYPKR